MGIILGALQGATNAVSKYAESEVKNQQELDLKKQIMAMEEEKALRMDEIKRQRDSAAAESERLASGQAIKDAQTANQAKTTENVAKENKAISGALNDVSQSQDPEVRGKLGAAAKLYADYESKSAKDRGLDEGTTGVINKLREAGRTKEANEFEQDRARDDGIDRDKATATRAEATAAEQARHNKIVESRQGAELALRQDEAKRRKEEEARQNDPAARSNLADGMELLAKGDKEGAMKSFRVSALHYGNKAALEQMTKLATTNLSDKSTNAQLASQWGKIASETLDEAEKQEALANQKALLNSGGKAGAKPQPSPLSKTNGKQGWMIERG